MSLEHVFFNMERKDRGHQMWAYRMLIYPVNGICVIASKLISCPKHQGQEFEHSIWYCVTVKQGTGTTECSSR
jgi:hypothetical protein